ncbi:hypothetical protein SH2C18_05040 [Clostridium sediminicola]|uniref:pilus assembly FimT family protein n=1 Tax=Clostridium sediminicola TaxID=3114879 RepID=UPI0031F213D7
MDEKLFQHKSASMTKIVRNSKKFINLKNKFYKNKGLSLLEVIIVLSIIMIFTNFCVFNYYSFMKNIRNNMDIDICSNEIVKIVDYGKFYCKLNKDYGELRLQDDDKIVFKCDDKVRYYGLPNDFQLYPYPKRIIINGEGEIGKACSIYFYDERKVKHCITIRVATNYVKVKY